MIDAPDATEPIENAEAADPIDPTDSTDPTEPTDRMEPREPMLSSESLDLIDQREPSASLTAPILAPPGCVGTCSTSTGTFPRKRVFGHWARNRTRLRAQKIGSSAIAIAVRSR